MSILGLPRAWRGFFVAASLACASQAGAAGSAVDLGVDEPVSASVEPFGLATAPVFAGELLQKWLGAERQIEDEKLVLVLCQEDPANCNSPATLKFLAIVERGKSRDGRARLGEINRAINMAIRPASDLALYGVEDSWSSPLATLARAAGDCEDYAIAKFVALSEAGIAPQDLRIVIVHDPLRGEDHAVASARLDGHWLLLDNRRMAMIEDTQSSSYRPLFVIDHQGARAYLDASALAAVIAPAPSPAGLVSPATPLPSIAP